MVFSSPVFLFFFLPITITLVFLAGKKFRNVFLILASLFFYTWGEKGIVLVIIFSIFFNYLFGILIERYRLKNRAGFILVLALIFNLGLLFFFKYTNFFIKNLSGIFELFSIPEIHIDVHLPIGISFFTFQALSYIIDVYRDKTPAQKNPLNIALYISLFPQLIAGPIIRYSDIVSQLTERKVKIQKIVSGIKLFVIGLGKKVLIADSLARVVDKVFALPENQLAFELTWLGLLAFTFQIYFDFSGYSDMAIGLGRIFGFDFLKNFNYPYISRSLTEFWRRWHISLSHWLRDYLFLPIAFALMRKYSQPRLLRIKTENWAYMTAMLATMFLGGLWHGASWNFVIWGVFHGFFVILEKFRWGKILKRLWLPLQHIYTLTIILCGWVFFRSESFGFALEFFKKLLDFKQISTSLYFLQSYLNNQIILALLLGMVFSTPVFQVFRQYYHFLLKKCANLKGGLVIQTSLYSMNLLFYVAIYLFSIMILAAETYFPFLYFRF